MTDPLAPLTERQLSALLVCAEGGSIAAIGHWKDDIEELERRGFLQRLDQFNYVSTPAGTKAAVSADDDNIRQFLVAASGTNDKMNRTRRLVHEAAERLAEAAMISAEVTNDTPQAALRKWLKELEAATLNQIEAARTKAVR